VPVAAEVTSPWGFWPGTLGVEALAASRQILGWAASPDARALAWAQWEPEAAKPALYRAPIDAPDRVERIPGAEPRSRLHEYGGVPLFSGAGRWQWLWIDDASQGIRAMDTAGAVHRLYEREGRRCGDFAMRNDGTALLFLEEDPVAERTRLKRLDLAGDPVCTLIADQEPFCAAPRWSPDGRRVAWISWSATAMPWESSELWVANADGSSAHVVAGGDGVSVLDPQWDAQGRLWCLSDHAGWWWLCVVEGAGPRPLCRLADSDMGRPPWQLGHRHFVLLPDGGAVVVAIRQARCRLLRLDRGGGEPTALPTEATDITQLGLCGEAIVFLGAGPLQSAGLWRAALTGDGHAEPWLAEDVPMPAASVSLPEAVHAEGPAGPVHGYLYPPLCPGHKGPASTAPPLILRAHGGPTAMRAPVFEPEVQFWTGRGFLVVELNYSGSSGHGRAYRERLRGQWGLLDRDDCQAMARALVAQGRVDPRALFIAGNSAGGLTVLNSLRGNGPFAGGLCRWGVADLERLAASTHRFERGYLSSLIGPLPEARAAYRWRSPVHHARRIRAPLLLIQGAEDRIVPPEQARAMAAAVTASGGASKLCIYPGEAHGLRRADNRAAAMAEELAFVQALLPGRY